MSERTVIGFDTETHPIGAQNLIPEIVCLTVSLEGASDLSAVSDPDDAMNTGITELFGAYEKVAHNIAFDLPVILRHRFDLVTQMFDQIQQGLFHDTLIREKLIALTTTGDLDYIMLPGGVKAKAKYSLADLVMFYFGEDISAGKSGEDAWRLNYDALAPLPSAEWPQEAREYAVSDAVWAERVFWKQEEKRDQIIKELGIDPFVTENFHVGVSVCLQIMAARGFAIDPVKKGEIESMLASELAPEKMNLLIEAGILRPAEEPRPYANGAKDHVEGCDKKGCNCPVKMTSGTKESVDTKKLQALVRRLCKERPDDFQIKMTDPSERFPEGQVSTDGEWLADYADKDPTLEQYKNRQDLQALVTRYMPKMNNPDGTPATVVHTQYNALVSTGRTSSFASDLYPSMGFQNMDVRCRGCFVPRPGYLLFSIDFGAMELCTFAQKCINLFGYSVLAQLINEGIDPHEYLGAQIAMATHPDFAKFVTENSASIEPMAVYETFHALKDDSKDFWKHFRTLAKPTGLGYPGGLGPETFIKYAKSTFGVIVDLETATQLRELWRSSLPEAVDYLKWVGEQKDSRNEPKVYENKEGRTVRRDLYAYSSPFGMYRAGCDFCAAANGAALQTPAGEAAKLAVFNVNRACLDPSLGSILLPDRMGITTAPIAFVHDEIVGEVRDDELASERAKEIARIMVLSMKEITPDVKPKAEPALMRRWNKAAEPVYDSEGNLVVWEEPQPGKD